MKVLLFVFSLCLWTFSIVAQTTDGLVGYYSFDNCDATNDFGSSLDGDVFGNPECGCGVFGNALVFDGIDDYVTFFNERTDLLSKDFTASFYIAPENTTGLVDIFSKRKLCTPDSAVSVRYEPSSRTIRAELSEGLNERAEISAKLPLAQCWFHIVWVRKGGSLFIYIDGVLASKEDFDDRVDARNAGTFSIANSPCLTSGESRYAGALDEFRIYERALDEDEIRDLYIPIDRLISQDTVLYEGTGMQIRMTNTCADDYVWTPIAGVDMPNSPEPFIIPPASETYSVVMDYGFCQSVDQVRIIAVDSTALDCEDIYLPNAFTPNDDGLNDEFGISNANFFLGDFISLELYDRWGSKVFEGITVDQTWDGIFNGQSALPGMYVYKVRFRCNDQDKIHSGSFNLLR